MNCQTLQLIVTYAGDITERVIESGVSDPSQIRLNASGNTEQVCAGLIHPHMDPMLVIEIMGEDLLNDARKNGEVLSHRWVTHQHIQP